MQDQTMETNKPAIFDVSENDHGGILHFCDENRGIYCPQHFVDTFDSSYYPEIEKYRDDLSSPDNVNYWEAWQELIDKLEITDSNGNAWGIYQDGDVYLICIQYMDDETYNNFVDSW